MQKISKQSTAFIDHHRNRESLWLKKLKKRNIGNKISEIFRQSQFSIFASSQIRKLGF